MKKKPLLVLVVLFLCLMLAGIALAASSENYDLPADAFSSGGGERSSTNHSLVDISGQSTIIGASGSPGYQLHAGFIPLVQNPSGGEDTATVRLEAILQGSSRPDPTGWEIPLTLQFFDPGSDPFTEPAVYEFNPTTGKDGGVAVCQVEGIGPGTYDITVDGETTLMNIKLNVEIIAGTNTVDMDTLLEGDANGDGIINISDFGILAVAFMSTSDDPNWDESADFDRNGIINISDFGLLAVNFMQTSPVTVP